MVFNLNNSTTLHTRAKVAHLTDYRIHLMTEVLAGIRVIKLYCWESYFSTLLIRIRALVTLSISSFDCSPSIYPYFHLAYFPLSISPQSLVDLLSPHLTITQVSHISSISRRFPISSVSPISIVSRSSFISPSYHHLSLSYLLSLSYHSYLPSLSYLSYLPILPSPHYLLSPLSLKPLLSPQYLVSLLSPHLTITSDANARECYSPLYSKPWSYAVLTSRRSRWPSVSAWSSTRWC